MTRSPPLFDVDRALKQELKDEVLRLEAVLKRRNRKLALCEKRNEDFQAELEQLSASPALTLQSTDHIVLVQTIERLKNDLARATAVAESKDEEIAALSEAVMHLPESAEPRKLVRVVLVAGLRNELGDLTFTVDLIIDAKTKAWDGTRAFGFARYIEPSSEIWPIIIDRERLDYGPEYENRNGILALKGRPIEDGQIFPFFPDGGRFPDGEEFYVIKRVVPVIEGRAARP